MSEVAELQQCKARNKVLLRRHINLLTKLRELGILATSTNGDDWHVTISHATLAAPAKAEGTQ